MEPMYTMDEVVRLLHIQTQTLRRLIAKGEFPAALNISPGVLVWLASDLDYYQRRIALLPRLQPSDDEPNSNEYDLGYSERQTDTSSFQPAKRAKKPLPPEGG